jgi:branched-chain amino acid transport system substrate-binding protein
MQRKFTRWGVALGVGVALVAAACGGDNKSSSSNPTTGGSNTTTAGGGGGTTCPKGIAIAFFGALTGSAANLGINIHKGGELAVEQWNKANPNCQLTMKDFDSAGDPKQAPALAQKVVSDKNVVGVLGPAFSGESKAANPIFNAAGLPLITASATNPTLSTNGWTVFHRLLATDAKQGPDAAKYLTDKLSAKKVFVVDDQSEYGKGIADQVRKTLSGAVKAGDDSIDPKATDYSATVTKIKGSGADGVFYGGYYAEAGKLVKQLRDGGYTGKFMSGDGSADPGFVNSGGPAAQGAILSNPSNLNGNPEFLAAYKAKFKDDPRTYGAEAYDVINTFGAAFKAGKTDRKSINEFLKTYSGKGVTRDIKFDDKGEIGVGPTFFFEVKSGVVTLIDQT